MARDKDIQLDVSDGEFQVFTIDGKTAYVGLVCLNERCAINEISKPEMLALGHAILSIAASLDEL